MPKHALCVFSKETVNELRNRLNEYPDLESIVFSRDGSDFYIDTPDGGDPLNDSRPCPGSPGCP
jgi:hypothetical protein